MLSGRGFRDRLRRRAKREGLSLTAEQASALETYFTLLATWNEKINLTGLDLQHDGEGALDRLIIEPLIAAKHVPAEAHRLLDVGSGGGSPAVPLKIACPHLHLTMVESKTRKSVFLREVTRALGWGESALVVTARYEELLTRPDLHEAHDIISIRAVRVESRLLMSLQALLRPGGRFFLFRSGGAAQQADHLRPLLHVKSTQPLLDSLGSRLLVLEKRLATL